VGAKKNGALGVDLSNVLEGVEEELVNVSHTQGRLFRFSQAEPLQEGFCHLFLAFVLLPAPAPTIIVRKVAT
jgi:hypothetical protein